MYLHESAGRGQKKVIHSFNKYMLSIYYYFPESMGGRTIHPGDSINQYGLGLATTRTPKSLWLKIPKLFPTCAGGSGPCHPRSGTGPIRQPHPLKHGDCHDRGKENVPQQLKLLLKCESKRGGIKLRGAAKCSSSTCPRGSRPNVCARPLRTPEMTVRKGR